MNPEFFELLMLWHDGDEHEKIIKTLEGLGKEGMDYALKGILARAYNNSGRYPDALDLLFSVADQGSGDPLWHFRAGYSYYFMQMERLALEEFERALELDPEDGDTRTFIRWCRGRLGMETTFKTADCAAADDYDPVIYPQESLRAVSEHIVRYFGSCSEVLREIVSPDIQVDIFMAEPSPERNFYTLVTVGMGAREMNVPEGLCGVMLERAELLLCLPPEWNVKSEDERWRWPVRLLKSLARFPGRGGTWLGWGHTVSCGHPLAENAGFTGSILLAPAPFGDGAAVCQVAGGEINFYQVVPLYEEEMAYKVEKGVEALLDRMNDSMLSVVDISRRNVCRSALS